MRTSLDHWMPLWQRIGAVGDAAGLHARLLAAYSEPQRAYHTLQHLEECLRGFDEVKSCYLFKQPDLIEMALWIHDVAYDPKSSDNEAQSARMAMDALGESETAREVARLIMLTKAHQSGGGPDDAWIIDIDLAIFAQSQARVMEYERQIREEYAWVPEALYREKRAEVLTGFLNREQIYLTAWARDRFEARGKENLRMLIGLMRE